MRKFFILISFFTLSYIIYAGERELLRQVIENVEQSNVRDSVQSIFDQYIALFDSNVDTAEILANQWIEISENTTDGNLLGYGYMLKGKSLMQQEIYDDATYNFLKAKDLFEEQNQVESIVYALNYLGLCERTQNNFKKAMEYLDKSLSISQANGLSIWESDTYSYMGGVYLRQTNYTEADVVFKKALTIRTELKDTAAIAASRINIALVKREVGDFEEALQNLEEAKDLYVQVNDIEGIAEANTLIGSIYFRKNDFNEALIFYYDAYNQRQKLGSPQLVSRSASNIGTAYKNLSMADSASKYYIISLEISNELQNNASVANALNNLGNLYLEINDLSNAMQYYIRALSIRQDGGDSPQLASTLKNIGNIYNSISRYDKANEYYLRAVEIEENLGDIKRLAFTLDFIGNSYQIQGKYDQSLQNYEKALKLRNKIGNQKEIAITLNNIGNLYYDQENFTEAGKYYNLSLKAGRIAGDKWRIAQELNNLGNIAYELDEQDQSLDYFMQAYELDKEIKNRFGEALVARKIGEIYLWREMFSEAIPYIENSLNIGMQLNNRVLIKNALYALYEYYRNTENYEKAMLYLYDYYAVQDSMMAEMSNKQVFDVQLNYEIEKREEQIEEIEKKNEILNIEKQLQSEQLKRKNLVVLSLVGIMLLLVTIVLLTLNRYNYRKKVAKTLNEKIKEVEDVNRALMLSQKELEISNATKDKFFSIIAHDLKNPIGGLMMAAEALHINKDLNEDDQKEYISVLYKSSGQLYSLLDNLLLWSRSQSGRIEVKPEMIFVKKQVQETIDLLSAAAENKSITLNNRVSDEVACYADPDLMKTIIRNIISNAIKFSNVGGKVQVSAKDKKNIIELYISDNGIGIREEDLKNLFALDRTKSTPGTNNESGTGLGLVITKEFIELNRGSVQVESVPEKGATFIIFLPKNKYNG